jgi:hypothetical protein
MLHRSTQETTHEQAHRVAAIQPRYGGASPTTPGNARRSTKYRSQSDGQKNDDDPDRVLGVDLSLVEAMRSIHDAGL